MLRKVTLIVLLGLFASPSYGEYRAFELQITNLQTGAQRTVLSNFDPEQYRSLYPVLNEEEVTMLQSWKCKGDTSKKPICPNPKATNANPPDPRSEPAP